MKVTVLSDLHCEIAPFNASLPGGDLLILAGDITCARYFKPNRTDADARSMRKMTLWRECAKYRHVLYVIGNHEHYWYSLAESVSTMRAFLKEAVPNARILDDEAESIDGVRFIGGTLWTDFQRENPLSMVSALQFMNDYQTITMHDAKLTPEKTLALHKKTLAFIAAELAVAGPKVVITHHPPSPLSLNKAHSGNGMDGAYASDLHALIGDAQDLRVWVHGHTHLTVDYYIGPTRIFANQRGYFGHEASAKLFEADRGFVIEA